MAMDVFLRPEEIAVRERVRDYLRAGRVRAPAGPASKQDPPDPRCLLNNLSFGGLPCAGPSAPVGLVGVALTVEELSCASPRLGRALIVAWDTPRRRTGPERAAADMAWSLGTAFAMYEACLTSARKRGFFDSTLMDHQKVQVGLAELLSILEAARLQSYRALHLIDRGKRDRGEGELKHAEQLAGQARQTAEALAAALLAEAWAKEGLPEGERSRP
jgi:alkylation response protein AidB-like acyl-CoA dehydrogenase